MAFSRRLTLVATLVASFASAQSPSKSGLPQPLPTTPALNQCLGYAQHPDLAPDSGAARPVPTVTFRLEMPTFNPKYYGVAVESDGKAAYVSEPLVTPDNAPGEPYTMKFVISQPTRQRIFELAQEAKFFQGNFDYKGKVANTGAKTLSYADGYRCTQTTYNWSENQAIQQLTTIFQGISGTMEFGRRLAFLQRFDKLGLDAEVKELEQEANSNRIIELQAIEPVLQKIASDYYVMNVARARIERVLAHIHPAK